MPTIIDPMDALVSLQQEIRRGLESQPGDIHKNIRVILDEPNGQRRLTYAKIEHGRVKAMAIFAPVEPTNGTPCFQGYPD